jgi:hypothetical protein
MQQAVIMHQIFNATPPPLKTMREGIPKRLAALVEQGLAKHREERPLDWDEYAHVLSTLSTDSAIRMAPQRHVLDSERFTLLRSLDFFADFGDVELWEVVRHAKWERHTFGQALYRKGAAGNTFHIIAQGEVAVYRDGQSVATLGTGTSVGEMAYLAPNPELRVHTVDVLVAQSTTTVSFTPDTLGQLTLGTRHLFDKAFIRVLVRRLHAANEAAANPRRIL